MFFYHISADISCAVRPSLASCVHRVPKFEFVWMFLGDVVQFVSQQDILLSLIGEQQGSLSFIRGILYYRTDQLQHWCDACTTSKHDNLCKERNVDLLYIFLYSFS